MSIHFSNEKGSVKISTEVIADVVGVAATECRGIVGMASTKRLKDGVSELLRRENFSKGISIENNEDDEIEVYLHVIIAYGERVSVVAPETQDKVKFTLEDTLGLSVASVNIIVEGVKIVQEPTQTED